MKQKLIPFAKGGMKAGSLQNPHSLEHIVVNGLHFYRIKGSHDQWQRGSHSNQGGIRIDSDTTYDFSQNGKTVDRNDTSRHSAAPQVAQSKPSSRKTAYAREHENDGPHVLHTVNYNPTQYNTAYKTFKEAYNAARKRGDEAFDFKGKVYYAFDENERNAGSSSGIRNYNLDDMQRRYGAFLGYKDDPNFKSKSHHNVGHEKINQGFGSRTKFEEDPTKKRQYENLEAEKGVPTASDFLQLGINGVTAPIVALNDAAWNTGKSLYNGITGQGWVNPITETLNNTRDYIGNTTRGFGVSLNPFNYGQIAQKTNSTDANTRASGYRDALATGVDGALLAVSQVMPSLTEKVGTKVDQFMTSHAPQITFGPKSAYVTKAGTVPSLAEGAERELAKPLYNRLFGSFTGRVPIQYGSRSVQRAIQEGATSAVNKTIRGPWSAAVESPTTGANIAQWATGALSSPAGTTYLWRGAPKVAYDIASDNLVSAAKAATNYAPLLAIPTDVAYQQAE